jgi:hypothetical protein
MFRFDASKALQATCIAGVFALSALTTACGSDANTQTGIGANGGGGGVVGFSNGGAPAMGSGGVTTQAPGSGGLTGSGGFGTAGAGTAGMGLGGFGVAGMGTAGMGVAGLGTAGTGLGGAGMAGQAGMGGLLGMGGAAGAGGLLVTGGTAGAGAGGSPMHADLGVGTGADVVLLGDSWMSNTLQIEGTGGGLAPALIAAAGKPYRNYGVQGVMLLMADTFGAAIPTQYDQAKAINKDIKTIVMTGGGNDIIQNPTIQSACMTGGDACKMLLSQIVDALNTLWTKMAADNVQDVVYVQYANDVGTVDPSLRMNMGVPTICTTGRIRCHSVDSTNAIMKQIAADGIHPLQAANTRLAKQVYDLMTSEGMRR